MVFCIRRISLIGQSKRLLTAALVLAAAVSGADVTVFVGTYTNAQSKGIYSLQFDEASGKPLWTYSYAVNYPDLYFRAATLIDKIFRGANPSELPVEQPTKLELVLNLTTATSLGLAVPQSLLARADEVIE